MRNVLSNPIGQALCVSPSALSGPKDAPAKPRSQVLQSLAIPVYEAFRRLCIAQENRLRRSRVRKSLFFLAEGFQTIGIKLSIFRKDPFVNLAQVAPPGDSACPQFWGLSRLCPRRSAPPPSRDRAPRRQRLPPILGGRVVYWEF